MIDVQDNKSVTRTVCKEVGGLAREVSADICIVGAGLAGVSAALEAARLGRKVILVDGLPTLGGQAVNSRIGLLCGLFANYPNTSQFTHGIADDILRDLDAEGALHYLRGGLGSVIYDDLALARWIEKAVRAAGITVILGGILRDVTRAGRRICSVDVATRYGDVRIKATGFIDASGDAALVWQAGLPCREPSNGSIYGSHMIVIDGIDVAQQPAREEFVARQKAKAKEYGLERTDGLVFVFPEKEMAFINMTHVETPLEPLAATAKDLAGKEQADAVFKFLKEEYPLAFGKARIRAYGLLGIRQTRWMVGRQQLTADDVRAGTRFADAIARTAWPMELHAKSEGFSWQIFPEDHVHFIPFGSLTPPDVDNLVAAGRCIDADVDALSSVRVLGPCIATGAAAAHTLDLAGEGSVHDIDIAALQGRVRDNLI
ncbi:FAD-dependent oxidoreductase [Sporomusa sp.]|uniref:FAD-dependent oxidoreductase n=1 Tax=Sporomusa sp. TaxID=2078658 RepID=UPI002CC5ABDB|nr:FAD-dependent oxidoreductase [Sporomusa sp.]HWR42295.1 FAD-dependent oxidoreductase [Sporomusa sp.]